MKREIHPVDDGKKKCTECEEIKILDNFHVKYKRKDGTPKYRAKCKSCHNADNLQRHKDKYRGHSRRVSSYRWLLKNSYELTEEDYKSMYVGQEGKCLVCEDKILNVFDPSTLNYRPSVVDHCHINGSVRGLLCRTCNTGIGMLNDNVAIVEQAVRYLKKWK